MAAAPPGQTSGSAGVQVCARRRAALRAAGRPRRPRARLRQHWVAVALVGGRALCWAAARGSPPGLMQLLGGEPTCLVRPLSGGAGGFGLEAPPQLVELADGIARQNERWELSWPPPFRSYWPLTEIERLVAMLRDRR